MKQRERRMQAILGALGSDDLARVAIESIKRALEAEIRGDANVDREGNAIGRQASRLDRVAYEHYRERLDAATAAALAGVNAAQVVTALVTVQDLARLGAEGWALVNELVKAAEQLLSLAIPALDSAQALVEANPALSGSGEAATDLAATRKALAALATSFPLLRARSRKAEAALKRGAELAAEKGRDLGESVLAQARSVMPDLDDLDLIPDPFGGLLVVGLRVLRGEAKTSALEELLTAFAGMPSSDDVPRP